MMDDPDGPTGGTEKKEVTVASAEMQSRRAPVSVASCDLTEPERRLLSMLEEGVDRAVALLRSETNPEIAKQTLIEILGGASGVDRVGVHVIFHSGLHNERCARLQREWRRVGFESHVDDPCTESMPILSFGSMRDALLSGRAGGFIVDSLPFALKVILSLLDIRSVVYVPIMVHDELWGFLSLADCRHERVWNEAELAVLTRLGTEFGAAVVRWKESGAPA